MNARLVLAAAFLFSIGPVLSWASDAALDSAAAPLSEGVPQVAIDRLQKLLTQNLAL